ncbi:MAG: hypothetical protein JO204_01260 [Alphaproteobacteria bacterium]|nr:hypothetical protein [Alphaproteobacteria bacterium]
MPEPTDTAAGSVSPFLLLPARPLPVFAAELRRWLDRVPTGAERTNLARMILVAECEIAWRRCMSEANR